MKKRLLLLTVLGCGQVGAASLVANDAQLRDDLTWLAGRGFIRTSLTTWPLNTPELNRALQSMRDRDEPTRAAVARRVALRLAQLDAPLALQGQLSSTRRDYPEDFAQTPYATRHLSAALHAQGERWDIRLRGTLEGHQRVGDVNNSNLNGSYAAGFVANQWLSFGELPQWWGPGYSGSLIRSDAARPVLGLMLQRGEQTPLYHNEGRWNYQLMAGQLRQYSRPQQPKLIGGRVTMMPADPVEIGLSRIALWGGKGRPQSAASLWKVMAGRDNTGDQRNDPGDQLGGMDIRLDLAPLWDIPLAVYGQVIGEDEAGWLPSHNTFLLGAESHLAWDARQINGFVELADTRSGFRTNSIIYTHYCYQDGYYQQGWPLGWAAGGDATQVTARLELVTQDDQRIDLRATWARVNRTSESINHAWPAAERLAGMRLGWTVPLGSAVQLSPATWYNARQPGGDEVGVGVAMELALF